MATNLSEEAVSGPVTETWFATIAGVLGNVLEWYDFALFGFFSDIIADVFFPPSENENANLIKSFAIFGGAFLMRPIGGLVIGYVGDKHGRKTALTKSLYIMAIPTILMGCLPSYDTVGWISPVLLCICRMIQGISVGGQLPASLVYTVEKRDPSTWGYYGSLPMVAANFGSLLGNLVGATLRSALSEEQLYNWGWRLPFFSGILIALVAWWLDKNGTEVHTTAGVYDQESSEIKNPLTLTFAKENRLALLSTALTPILWAGGFYLSFVWMAVYMGTLLNPPIPGAFWINAGSMLIGMTFMLPIAGSISDRVGRVKMMTIAAILLTAGGPLLLIMISKGDAITAFLCQVTIGIFLSFYGGSLCAWLVESFPAKVRLTSASLGYDLAHALVGGFSPVMATQLFDRYGVTSPGWLYVIFGSLSLLGLYINYFCGNGPGQEKGSEEDEKPEQELPEIA